MTSTPLEQTDEGRAFLQQRVARFGLYGAAVGWFFVLFRTVDILLSGHDHGLREPSMGFHVLAAASLTGIWLLCRTGRRSVAFVRVVEHAGLLLACVFYSLMGLYIPVVLAPYFIVILALGLGLIARATYVPSSGRRTLLITSLAGLPLLASTYGMYADVDLSPLVPYVPELAGATSTQVAWGQVLFAAAWWSCIVALCTGASRVIYGLRKEVRNVRKLGQYTLREKLGEGAMGAVYRATHAMLRRPTAVKLLTPDKADEHHIARFEKEVQLTAVLTHPNTVTIYDYGRTPEGLFYYAMEFLDGATLTEVVAADGPQPPARVVRILDQAAGALAEAHAVGLIHRDVKPANIMLVEQVGKPDVAKVLDFGLVKQLERLESANVTQEGVITGTPQYLAPEAIRTPDDVGPRSDIYALGAVGYFLLAGRHAFEGETVVEVCAQQLHATPPPLSEQGALDVPVALEALILRCLAKDPAERPAGALALQEALASLDGQLEPWSMEDAQSWWRRHRPTLAARRVDRADAEAERTLDVALRDR